MNSLQPTNRPEGEQDEDVVDDRPDLERLHSRDTEAFNHLYERHARVIRSFIFVRMRHAEDVEELLQDTFMTLWEYPPEVSDYPSIQSWLFTVARSRIHDLLRTRSRASRKATVISVDELHDEKPIVDIPDPFPTPDEDVANEEVSAFLIREVDELPEHQRVTIRARYFENFSKEEMAKRLNISQSTVIQRLASGRDALRQRLHPMLSH